MTMEMFGKSAVDLTVRLAVAMFIFVGVRHEVSADELADGNNGISLIDHVDAQRETRVDYSFQLKGTLSTPSTSGTDDWNLNSTGTFAFQQRRFPFDGAGPFGIRAVRRFETAQTDSSVGKDHKTTVVLPSQAAVIQLYGEGNQLLQLSPDVRLNRAQVDLLQIPCDPVVATGLLPARNLKDQHEKWNADTWVIPMLTGVDAAISQSATCQLKSLTEKEATVIFEGSAEGAVVGSATKVTIKGEFVFDRVNSLIRSFDAVQSEKREPGPFSPGLNVEATMRWTQAISTAETGLPESMSDELPDERQKLLTLATPARVLMLHNRNWHVFHETAEMVMLRMIHDGALVAQCNISPSPAVPAGKFTTEQEYLAEVQTALADRKGSVKSSKIHDDINGWRIHHVRALGNANDKALIWDYFLCTAKSGQQLSLIFSYAEEDEKVVAGSPEQMLGTLTIRSNRPKVALPR